MGSRIIAVQFPAISVTADQTEKVKLVVPPGKMWAVLNVRALDIHSDVDLGEFSAQDCIFSIYSPVITTSTGQAPAVPEIDFSLENSINNSQVDLYGNGSWYLKASSFPEEIFLVPGTTLQFSVVISGFVSSGTGALYCWVLVKEIDL